MMVALSALELVQGLHDVLDDVILLRHLALYLLPLHLSHGVVDGAEQPVDLLDNALTTRPSFQQESDLQQQNKNFAQRKSATQRKWIIILLRCFVNPTPERKTDTNKTRGVYSY